MRKIKNFFSGLIGLLFLGAVICWIFEISFKQLILYCILGFLGLTALLLLKDYLIVKLKSPKPTTNTAQPQPVQKTEAQVHSNISTDKDDYAYAYDHIGLFRPKGTPGPMPPVGTDVFFEEEPNNPYDSEAVKAVWYHNGEKLLAGYMFRSDETIRGMVRDWLARDDEYYAVIISTADRPRLFIGFNR